MDKRTLKDGTSSVFSYIWQTVNLSIKEITAGSIDITHNYQLPVFRVALTTVLRACVRVAEHPLTANCQTTEATRPEEPRGSCARSRVLAVFYQQPAQRDVQAATRRHLAIIPPLQCTSNPITPPRPSPLPHRLHKQHQA